jgi:serine/threonine protein kinase
MSWDLDSQTKEILQANNLSAIEKQNDLWGNHVTLSVEELIGFGVIDPKDTEPMLDLIFNEIRLREPLNPDHFAFIEREYLGRFPSLSKEIQEQFECEKELARCFAEIGRLPTLSPPEFGIQIPGYSITETVGSGGFGTVYKAKQIDLNRTVAIKVLRINDIQAKSPFEDFRNEALKASRLFHKNIVEVYEVGEQPDFFFVVMPFVEGGSLRSNRDKLKNRFDDIARIVADICRAVQYAHDLSILHCDITPNNILLGSEQRPMLVDFGLSRDTQELAVLRVLSEALNQGVDQDLKVESGFGKPASFGGTPGYMSPEQSSGDLASLSEKTDIFSLGAVLFFLITGKDYNGNLCEEENWRCGEEQNNLPIDLVAICSKCVSIKAEDRYRTAEDIALDLERYRRKEIVHARPLQGLRNAPERFSKWMKRSPAVAAWSLSALLLGSTLFITLIASFVLVTWKSHETTKALKQSAVAAFELGKLAASNGTAQQAIDSYSKAISVQEQLVNLFPNEPEYCLMLAKTRNNLALTLSEISDSIGSPIHFQQSISLLNTLEPPDYLRIEWLEELANIHENFGNYLLRSNRTEESLSQYQTADRVRKTIYPKISPGAVFAAAKSLMSFAGIKALNHESIPLAIKDYMMAIEKFEQLESEHYALDEVFEKLQIANINLAKILPLAGGASDASVILKESVEKWDSALQVNPENHKARRLLAICLTNYGNDLSRQGKDQQAILSLTQARIHYINVMESEKIGFITEIYYGACLNFLSSAYRALAQDEYQMSKKVDLLKECKLYSEESVRLLSGSVNRNKYLYDAKTRLVGAHRNLASYHLVSGNFDPSIESYNEALRILNESSDPTLDWRLERIRTISDLSRALLDYPKSRTEEARQLLKQGLEEGYSLVRGDEVNTVLYPLLQVLHDGLGLADFKEGYTSSDPSLAKKAYLSGINHFSQSIEIAEKSRSSDKLAGVYVRILNETYGRRAGLYELTEDYGASIRDWRVLIERGETKNPDHILYRLSLATALAKYGEIIAAWDEIRSVESILQSNVYAPFMAACCLCEIYRQRGLNSEGGKDLSVSVDALLLQIFAHLETAESVGYFDTQDGLLSLQNDPSLLPIRTSPEFKQFLDRIVAKSKAQKNGQDPAIREP